MSLKKIIKRFVFTILFILVAVSIFLVVSGNSHLFRGVAFTYLKGKTTANINDAAYFQTREIAAGKTQEWPVHPNYNKVGLNSELTDYLKKYNSVGFLIVKDGKLYTEKYFAPYNNRSKTNSFSMAKTILTMLVGAAIEDGFIKSFDDLLENYIPEFKGRSKGITLAHLSGMRAGLEWDENYYSPFSRMPKLMYGFDSENYMISLDFLPPAGKRFYYASAETQILGMALRRALNKGLPKEKYNKTLSGYLSEKFWKPLGMNDNALWHTDAEGMELVYCCVNTNLRNFAKFGQLLLQKGNWKGKQLLSAKFIERMRQNDLVSYYGHSLWIDERHLNKPEFFAFIGHLGQFIIVIPKEQMVVVRLGERMGKNPDKKNQFIADDVYFYAAQARKMVAEKN